MYPNNSPSVSSLTIIILFTIIIIPTSSTSTSTCSTSTQKQKDPPCPPFSHTSTLPFPFSSSPGCGHPSFQLRCSTPHSLISINNLSFSILAYNPNSSSITLSPNPQPHSHNNNNNCSHSHSLSIPSQPINLSSSPFRTTDSSCSRLSFLQPCSPQSLPNCSLCPWQCKLIKNPTQLFQDCTSMHHSLSDPQQPSCQTDLLSFLDQFLQSGIELEWDQSQDPYFTNCKTCLSNNGLCGFNSSHPSKPFLCFRSQSTLSPPWIRKMKPNKIAVFSLLIAFASLILLVSVATAVFRSSRFKSLPETEQDPTTLFLRNQRSLSLLPPVFTYDELASSTNHFDPKRKIGDGGFGSVYLGNLRDGRLVAVKHLHRQCHHATASFSTKSFCNEILILSSINHPNLVKLHGYCSDPRGLLLVYDYVPNGTLAEHLHSRKNSLTWQVRLDIALQTALAMEYLHFAVVPPVVHRDITSANIFIEKDMRIKVGDFGLSRLLVLQDNTTSSSSSSSNGFVWTGPQGTPGYLDPDYHRSFRLTEKSDVYSFGVVLLELISGLRAVDQNREKREMALADLVVSRIQMGLLHQVLDPFLEQDCDAVPAVAELAFRCVAADKDDRPDSKEVVAELKRVRSRMRGGEVAAKE